MTKGYVKSGLYFRVDCDDLSSNKILALYVSKNESRRPLMLKCRYYNRKYKQFMDVTLTRNGVIADFKHKEDYADWL